jgi:ABC-type multidrug transport system ATPase subunit
MSTVAARNGLQPPVLMGSSELHDEGEPSACSTEIRRCMVGFETVNALKTWAAAHPGRAGLGIIFGDTAKIPNPDGTTDTAQVITSSLDPVHIRYEVWYNQTSLKYKWYANAGADVLGAYADAKSAKVTYEVKDTSLMLLAQRAVDEAVLAWQAERVGRKPSDVRLGLELKAYPRLEDLVGVMQGFVPLSVFLATSVPPFISLVRIVSDKERKISAAMRTTGMIEAAFWLAHWARALLTCLLTSALVQLVGTAFGFGVFVSSEPSLLFVLLLCYTLSMASAAFVVASLVSRVRTAAAAGFALLIPCAALTVLAGVYESVAFMWWEKRFSAVLTVLLSVLVPPFNLGKLLADAAQITKPIQVLDEGSASVVLKASGTFGWSSLTQYRPNRTASVTYRAGEICDTVCKPICATVCTTQDPSDSWYIPPPPLQALAFLLLATALYAFLAWYFAQIFTGDAHSEQAGFFLSSAYWRGAARDSKEAVRAVKAALRDRLSSADDDDEVDSDVAAEARAVCEPPSDAANGSLGGDAAVEIINVQKTFQTASLDGLRSVHAVKGVSLRMAQSQCFSLLGHNGAGKTTLLRLATAQLRMSDAKDPSGTGGDVVVYGKSVRTQAATVRQHLGFCPQHDVLCEELTPLEHLELFGAVKGLSRTEMAEQSRPLLEGVKLLHVANKLAGGFSGGMKRRLSCALALVGEPNFVLLDEPTTGMDPMNRREVWSLIRASCNAKRTVLLTTHSMEEADALGDRVGIQSGGRLIALGTSLHLKQRFGTGYRLRLVSPSAGRDTIKARVAQLVPAAILLEDHAGSLSYSLPAAVEMSGDGGSTTTSSALPPPLLEFIERVKAGEEAGLQLTDWGVSHTTLEDVFLTLAKQRMGATSRWLEHIP